MVGSGLKKLAQENGMKIDKGVAYGSLRGFAATMMEGSGYKQIIFATSFVDPVGRTKLTDLVQSLNLKKEYRVRNLQIDAKRVYVVFNDNPGTMKKIYAFLDWFIPLLQEHGASGVNFCNECGMEVGAGKWILINGIAYHLHEGCAEHLKNEVETENIRKKEELTGSYALGAAGAFAGAAIGAIVWALILLLGYVASVVGLLIGVLAEKGYNLLHGKNGKAKILILILAIIFGVAAGTVAADALSLIQMIKGGELPGWYISDVPEMMMILFEDAEYVAGTGKNILLGLVFAALGVFALLRNAGRETADIQYAELN